MQCREFSLMADLSDKHSTEQILYHPSKFKCPHQSEKDIPQTK